MKINTQKSILFQNICQLDIRKIKKKVMKKYKTLFFVRNNSLLKKTYIQQQTVLKMNVSKHE